MAPLSAPNRGGDEVSYSRETLMLYRMRPTVHVQVVPGSRTGRVRYSRLKGDAAWEGVYANSMVLG
jgi:hypothetical protein